jgi:two-component system, sensor histidine kinase RpfC
MIDTVKKIGCSSARQTKFETEFEQNTTLQKAPKPCNILVADDNRTNRNVLAAILETAGHVVQMVDDGDTALDALGVGEYDILLIDVNMPRLNGIEVCKMWRQIEGGASHLPILGVTADATQETEKKCLAAGMDLRLTKPINAKFLLEIIARLCPDRNNSKFDAEVDYDLSQVVVPVTEQKKDTPSSLNADQIEYLYSIGDAVFVATMIEGFLEDAIEMIVPMRKAAAEGDVNQFRFCAHGLKSSGNNIGALNLAAIGAQIERITETEFQTDGLKFLALIEAELVNVQIDLDKELKKCGSIAKQS